MYNFDTDKKKVRSTGENMIADLALKSFRLIYKSSNFSKYFGVDVITIILILYYKSNIKGFIKFSAHDQLSYKEYNI